MNELLAALLGRPAWHADAACREHPEVDWLPARGASSAPAKAVCASCLVRGECLAAGLLEPEGIWAGLSWEGRRRLRVEAGEIVVGRHRAVA